MNFRETDRSLQVAGCRREAKTGGRKEQRALPIRAGCLKRDDESCGGDQDEIVLGGRPNQRRWRCEHFVLALAEIGLFGRPLPPAAHQMREVHHCLESIIMPSLWKPRVVSHQGTGSLSHQWT
jgi:hypothetical protein